MSKYLAMFLSTLMIVTSLPTTNLSANTSSFISDEISIDNKDSKEKDLEKAILNVKSKVTIPEEFSVFNYYYDTTYHSEGYWRLSWSNKEGSKVISVECDNNYNINYYRKSNYEENKGGIPVYLKDDLLNVAEDFIKDINPQVAEKVKFTSADFESVYTSTYVYNFQRVENGIDFPDNTASVRVDGITGQVVSLNINWLYDVKIPTADRKVTKDEATKIIADNLNMELAYRTNFYYTYMEYEDVDQRAFLVYEPDKSYISVDAKNGQVYLSRQDYIERDASGSKNDFNEEVADADSSLSDLMLTDEELKKIQELELLISREEAIEIVKSNPYLYFGENLTESKAYLGKLYNWNSKDDETYYWRIELRDPRPIDYSKSENNYRAYSYAVLDAKTGRIVSYYSNLDDIYNGFFNDDIKYNKKASQRILEEFLEKEASEYFSNSKFVNSNNDHIIYYDYDKPVYRGYSFSYKRVNEGVIYPYDGIYGAVDGVTGKIYSYNYSWTEDVEFESPKNAMTPEEAFDYYISKEGYKLVYEVNQKNIYDSSRGDISYDVEYEVRLVYRPDIYPQYISPFTGDQLTGTGEVNKERKDFEYKDINKSEKNRNILLLADMNIGFEGEYFLANREITYGEYQNLMKQVNLTNYGSLELKDNKKITREEISVDIIIKLGLEDIAILQGIFNPGFDDQEEINEEYLGAVSLAKGLGIIDAEDNRIKPRDTITRRQVVDIILNYLNIY